MQDWRAARDQLFLALQGERRPSVRAELAADVCDVADTAPDDERAEFSPQVVWLLADKQLELNVAGLALASSALPLLELRPLLVSHLTHAHPRVRTEAAGRLADLGLPDLRGPLAAVLEDAALQVRFEAARGIAALKHGAGFDVLVEALDDRDLRFRAASALAQLGDPRALPPLRRAFDKWIQSAFDKTQLAGALAQLGDEAGVQHLLRRVRKRWSMDRPMAIELLGQVKAAGAKPVLLSILDAEADGSRGAAARALGFLGDVSVLPTLAEALGRAADDDLKLDLAFALLRLDPTAAKPYLEALTLSTAEARAELAALLEDAL